MPKVSVLMPVYNGEKYIAQAINSVLTQSFRDFELLVFDDGSTDKSAEIIASYRDRRVRYLAHPINLGLSEARNRAIEASSGEYLAWLDSDDVSLSQRLLRQVALLDGQANLGLCGTWVRTLGLRQEQVWKYPVDPVFVRGRMLFDNPIATSAVMLRRSCLAAANLRFNTNFTLAEDYELWERISRKYEVCNISEVHTLYRIHANQITTIKSNHQLAAVWAIQTRLLQQLQVEPTAAEKALHLDIGVGWHFLADKERLEFTEAWLVKLAAANDSLQVFPKDGFRCVLAERWLLANFAALRSEQTSWRRYGKSLLSNWEPRRMRKQARLLFESMRHVL
ncbi:Glycosyl transferase family 2 [Desulfomicrobium norvegicum]|uniref:Glycosyl transferase family 2 n=1 Tax=Desulfomicrobium norvegicum (strain DSM 1741 / NCIMB 8310) TaxID=52561 RepID=A0A8G2F793_DESNO|nr:glycosyltransferase [Desulfomicrobium norvegicum]SFL47026.1 Glycosyl transferase family 2 [Desulfomicrobium norvegicum]